MDEYDGLASSQTSILKKSLKNSSAESSCRSLRHCVYRSFFGASAVFLQLHCSWGFLLAWRITFQDCIAEKPTHCGPARRHFPTSLDQNAIFNGKNNGTTYANQNLGMKIKWKILARQKADMELHSHPIVWREADNTGQQAIRQKNPSGGMKGNGARDKRWTQRNEYRETKECGREYDGNRYDKQKRFSGRRPEISARNKRTSIGRQRKPRYKTKQSRWRRSGTSARNKGSQLEDKVNCGAKQNEAAGESLELVRNKRKSFGRQGNRQEYKRTPVRKHKDRLLEKEDINRETSCTKEKRDPEKQRSALGPRTRHQRANWNKSNKFPIGSEDTHSTDVEKFRHKSQPTKYISCLSWPDWMNTKYIVEIWSTFKILHHSKLVVYSIYNYVMYIQNVFLKDKKRLNLIPILQI